MHFNNYLYESCVRLYFIFYIHISVLPLKHNWEVSREKKKKLAALSMLHKAKKAYYAYDVIRFLVPYAARLKLLVFLT